MSTFFHSGDIGDIIAALPVVRQLGGGHIIIGDSEVSPRESMRGARYAALAPLLESQPYIKSVQYKDKAKADYDFNWFRNASCAGKNLAEWHAIHLGIKKLDLSPWISATPSEKTKNRLVCARSARYRNPTFPWKSYLSRYAGRTSFIGLQGEYLDFRQMADVEWLETKDLKQVAEYIAGCELFIGNQSSPSWIAMGLGHNLIQESDANNPNSVVHRPNARFVFGPKTVSSPPPAYAQAQALTVELKS